MTGLKGLFMMTTLLRGMLSFLTALPTISSDLPFEYVSVGSWNPD